MITKCRQDGFSLAEVLASIFVLSLGVIGAVGMQLVAVRTTQQSTFQTAALQLAAEMAEKIRANTEQMQLDDQANPFLTFMYRSAEEGEPAVPEKRCYLEPCNSAELADFDLYEWKKRIYSSLPYGRAVICRDASPWDPAQASLTWACQGGSEKSSALVIKLGWHDKSAVPSAGMDAANSFVPSVAITVGPYLK